MGPDGGVLLDAALRGDHRTVRGTCSAALADGLDIGDLVVDVLAPVQRQVGCLWLAGRLSVADEHRVSAAVDSVLAAVEHELLPPTQTAPVVSVCAEGEWHAMAARMLALVLGSRGWPVIFLGASLPAADLATVARDTDAAAVAVSTSTVAALPGAARCVQAVVEAGRPVMVGGHAFDAAPSAAAALAVPVFDDPREAAAAVGALPLPERPVELADSEGLALDAAERKLVACAIETFRDRHPIHPSQELVVRDAAAYAVGLARAAVLLHDRSVISSHVDWLETFLGSRGVGVGGTAVLEAVSDAGARILDDVCRLRAVMPR